MVECSQWCRSIRWPESQQAQAQHRDQAPWLYFWRPVVVLYRDHLLREEEVVRSWALVERPKCTLPFDDKGSCSGDTIRPSAMAMTCTRQRLGSRDLHGPAYSRAQHSMSMSMTARHREGGDGSFILGRRPPAALRSAETPLVQVSMAFARRQHE